MEAARARGAAVRGPGGGPGHRRPALFRRSRGSAAGTGYQRGDHQQVRAAARDGRRPRRGGDGAGLAAAGSREVTVMEGAPRLLAREEAFAGEEVPRRSRPKGSR